MEENFYSTTDLQLATIISMNFPIRELQNQRGRGIFVFDKTPQLDDFIKAYWDKQLSVEPQALFNAMATLKNRLYSEVKREY